MIEQQELDFLRTFWSRKAVIAYTLFALNILVFILVEFCGGSFNTETLLAFGAKSNFHIDNGEIWRFLTPIFIHIGLLHLFFNCYALWIVGPQVEKLYGSSRFLLLYVLTGIAGVVASYFYRPLNVSAGASGAIFGLFGVLLTFSFKYRKSVPAFFSKAIGKGALWTVGINLVIGYWIPQIDNSAHLGGLVAGGLLAIVVPFQKPGEVPGKPWAALQAGIVVLIALSFFAVATRYNGPGPSLNSIVNRIRGVSGSPVGGFIDAINSAQDAFGRSESVLSSGDLGELSEVRRGLGVAIEKLQHIPSLSTDADKLSSDLLDVLQKQYAYVEEVERSGKQRSDFIGASPQSTRYRRLKANLEKWVEEDGAKYGIVNRN